MPNYRYKGFDIRGFEQEGTVSAPNAQVAAQQVAATGIRVRMVSEVKDAPAAPVQPSKPAPAPAMPIPAQPVPPLQRPSRVGAARPASPVVPTRTAPRATPVTQALRVRTTARQPAQIVHTAMGTDKDRMFLFSQFAAGLRAGMNPADFLGGVAPRTKGIFKESLQKMSEAAREGIPMSDVMERYPDLYPPHVPAMVRSGEVGGFLPEACETIGQQAEQAYKFNRWFAWVWFVIFNFALSIPGIFWVRSASNNYLDDLNKAGGGFDKNQALQVFGSDMWQMVKWPYGPLTAVSYFLVWLLWKFYLGSNTRALRHEIGLKWPAFGTRARAENLTIFAWAMGKLTKAGLPHAQAWELASKSVPNLAVSKRLTQLGVSVGRERPISQAFHESRLFPPEYGSVAATGEMTGDMASAMEQLASMSRTEYESAQNMAKIRGAGWGILGCAVTSCVIMAVLFWWYLHEVPEKLLGDDNPLK